MTEPKVRQVFASQIARQVGFGKMPNAYDVLKQSLSAAHDRTGVAPIYVDEVGSSVSPDDINTVDAALDHLVKLLNQREVADKNGQVTNIDLACEELFNKSFQFHNKKERKEAKALLKSLYALHKYGVTDVGYKPLFFSATKERFESVQFQTFDKVALSQRIDDELAVITKCEEVIVAAVDDEVLSKTYATDPRLIRLQSENESIRFARMDKGLRAEPALRAERPKVIVRKSVRQMADLRN